jgi:hypothetical protein
MLTSVAEPRVDSSEAIRAPVTSRVSRHTSKYEVKKMTIEITGPPETPVSGPPDALQQNGVQTQDQASVATALITQAGVALGAATATGVHWKERRWIALLDRIFVAAPKESRPKRGPYLPRMAYLADSRMAREMERL